MTAPERKIRETQDLLNRSPADIALDVTQLYLKQILSNQITLLRAVKVLLSWDQE